ncbi:MAG: hypothetical protein J4G09_02205 [Proteobacteria bacterium]|nr:hypothetical protein [Pseudomonadota bacterium]
MRIETAEVQAATTRHGRQGGSRGGALIQLQIGQELVEVSFDETGIHFSQDGASHPGGTLPWGVAIAMSLIPANLPRTASATAV